jgi:hypothetical protein
MRPRDWFSVGVRLLGVWVLYRGVSDLLHVGASVLGIRPVSITKEFNDAHTALMYDLWYAAGFLAFSLYLIFGAEHLTRWVYAESSLSSDDDGSGDSE